MSKFEHDLTTGNVLKKLLWFAIPFFISNLIQSVYSLTDLIILGNFGGSDSLSAVNTSGGILTLLTNFASGLSVGGTMMIGNYLGAGKRERINNVISTFLITLFSLGLIFMTILLLFNKPILLALKVPTDAFSQASGYLYVCASGLIFIYGYNALSAIMRGLGESKTPMVFIIIAAVINIILDLVFVGRFRMGATGAAFATIIAQGFSMIACIVYLKLHGFIFDFKPKSFVFIYKEFINLIKTGFPVSVQQLINNFSFLILTSFVNTLGGVDASAASGIVMNFNGFAILPSVAISSSASAMISQSMGKGNEKRAKQSVYCSIALCYIVCVIVFMTVRVFPDKIFMLFGADASVLKYGIPYITVFSFEYVTLPLIISFNTMSTGTGNGWVALVTNTLSAFIVRMPLAYIFGFVLNYGVVGVGAAIPLATIFGSFVAFCFYKSGVWKRKVLTE